MELEKKSIFAELAELIATEQVEALESKGKLPIPKENYIKQKAISLTEEWETENTKFIGYMKKAKELLEEDLNLLPPSEKKSYSEELLIAAIKLENPPTKEVVAELGSWQKALGLNNETLLWIYNLGSRFFNEKHYEEAVSLFSFLTLLNPMIWEHWIALGFAQKELNQDIYALNSLSLASLLNPHDPTSRFQSAKIHLKLSQFDEALLELEELQKIITEQNLEDLKPHLEFLLNQAKNKQTGE